MTRTNLLSLVLIISSCTCYAKDYTSYYRHVQLAEECLLNIKFEKALSHYDSALSNDDFKFARDCIIAAQLSASLHKNEITFRYLAYCIEAGISLKCLKEWKIFDTFFKSPNGKELVRIEQVYRNRYLNRIDTNLNKEMTLRYDREQATKGGDTATYFNVLDSNINWIKTLLEENKLPCEKVIGLKNSIVLSNAPNMSKTTCCYSTQMAIATLLHYDYSYEMLKSKLIKAMYEGYIYPRELVQVLIFNMRHNKTRPPYRKYNRKPPQLEILFEKTNDSAAIFNKAFEGVITDDSTADHYRQLWFIPRTGAALSPEKLLKFYGINIMIGYW